MTPGETAARRTLDRLAESEAMARALAKKARSTSVECFTGDEEFKLYPVSTQLKTALDQYGTYWFEKYAPLGWTYVGPANEVGVWLADLQGSTDVLPWSNVFADLLGGRTSRREAW